MENKNSYRLMSYITDGSEYHGDRRVYIGYSLHLAASADGGKTYTPLNCGAPVFYEAADFEEKGVDSDGDEWCCGYDKCTMDPYIFRTADGFGVILTRTSIIGKMDSGRVREDDIYDGCVQLYFTKDFDRYENGGRIRLSDKKIYDPSCEYSDGVYVIGFTDSDGNRMEAVTADLKTVSDIKKTDKKIIKPDASMFGHEAEGISELDINSDEYELICRKLITAYNTGVEIPESIEIKAGDDINKALPRRLRNFYSDGGEQYIDVKWNTEGISTAAPGEYIIKGVQQEPVRDKDFIPDRADPVVTKYNGKYYFIATWDKEGQNYCYISAADSIEKLPEAEWHVIAKAKNPPIWAPELHIIDGKPMVLCSTGVPEYGAFVYSHVMEATGDDLLDINCWSEPRPIKRADGSPLGKFTLDMTYFEWNGRHYYMFPICKGKMNGEKNEEGYVDNFTWISDIYIAEFDPSRPDRLISDTVLITRPTYSYERANTHVDEGPFALKHDGRLFVTIAVNEVGDGYGIKLLGLKKNGDPMNPDDWYEKQRPLLSRADCWEEPGPGHSSFVKDDNGDDLLFYHWKGYVGGGLGRITTYRLVHYNAEGEPVLNINKFVDDKFKNVSVKVIVK